MTEFDSDAGDGCTDCGCPLADHNNAEIGGCTSCGDCDGWV